MDRSDKGTRGLLWSHLLASVCGGLVLAGVLLGFGVIGKQRTVTVPIDDAAAPPTTPGSSSQAGDTAQIYRADNPAVLHVRAVIDQRIASPFFPGTETKSSTSTGSGFLIAQHGDTGYVLTTFHEIEGSDPATGITVQLEPGISHSASVEAENQADDVALLQVSMKGLAAQITPLVLGNPLEVGVGDSTLTIANPYGSEPTLTTGIVSSLQRQLIAADGTTIDDVIQTDSPTSPGASGSPLLDVNGQVLGVNDEIEVSSGGSSYMVGFAIPIDTVRSLIIPKSVL